MEDVYNNTASQNNSYNYNQMESEISTVSYVTMWIVICIGLPLTIMAIYALYSLVCTLWRMSLGKSRSQGVCWEDTLTWQNLHECLTSWLEFNLSFWPMFSCRWEMIMLLLLFTSSTSSSLISFSSAAWLFGWLSLRIFWSSMSLTTFMTLVWWPVLASRCVSLWKGNLFIMSVPACILLSYLRSIPYMMVCKLSMYLSYVTDIWLSPVHSGTVSNEVSRPLLWCVL